MYMLAKRRARAASGVYFTCQGVLTLKIRSPDRVSGLNVSQVPFSSNVSIERSNSRERFLDFCREPERTAFSLRTVSIGDAISSFGLFLAPFFSPSSTPSPLGSCFISSPTTGVSARRSFILVYFFLPATRRRRADASPERNLKPIQVSAQ